MKIDKIIFSSSELFSPFWNIQAPLWRSMGIEPVCLLWGKIENTNMNPELGEIIEKEFNPDLYESFQITWSKFYHTSTEPETTWLIGDMDLVPLQSKYFTEGISALPAECYTHLAFGEIPRNGVHVCNLIAKHYGDFSLSFMNMFEQKGGFYDGGMDIPAYYHVAKGKIFSEALGLGEKSFDEQVKWVCESKKFGLGPLHDNNFHHPSWESVKHQYDSLPIPEDEKYIWVADEGYSSHRIWTAHQEGRIKFIPYLNPIMGKTVREVSTEKVGNRTDYQIRDKTQPSSNRLDRASIYRTEEGVFYNVSSLSSLEETYTKVFDAMEGNTADDFDWNFKPTYNTHLDVHCHRPFEEQEAGLRQLLDRFWPSIDV